MVLFTTQFDTGRSLREYAGKPLMAGELKGNVGRIQVGGVSMARGSVGSTVSAPLRLRFTSAADGR